MSGEGSGFQILRHAIFGVRPKRQHNYIKHLPPSHKKLPRRDLLKQKRHSVDK